MRLTKSALGRAALIGAATGLLVGTLLSPASAAQAVRSSADAQSAAAAVATSIAATLGDRSAGSYLDQSTGALVVTVTDAATAAQVRAAGAVPRLVAHSGAQLAAGTTELERSITATGTAWAVDPVTNQILVSVDSTVTGDKLAQVRAVVDRLGDLARLESVPGEFSLRIAGGDAIFGGQFRCSLGFNVQNASGAFFFLTAGHCGNIASTWYANSAHTTVLGTTAGSSFPGNDYAIVRYTGTVAHTGNVDLYGGTQEITTSGNAVVGQTVRRSGSTTHVHSGTVTAVNATVRYAEGTVTGLIRTTVCAEGGDSGGSLFAGTTALGLTSGGSGNCSSGGTTFFQPVSEALSVFGMHVF